MALLTVRPAAAGRPPTVLPTYKFRGGINQLWRSVCSTPNQRPIKDKDGVPGRTTSVAKREGEEEVVEEEGAFSLSLFESEASNSIRHRCQISYVTSSSPSLSSSNVFFVELEHDSNSRTVV